MDKLMVKLPPSFDLRASNAASEWRLWRASFEDYLISTKQDVSSDRIKLALLRNMIGIDSARVLLTLPLTEDKASNYESVMAAIEKYVSPRVNEVFERYKFNERKQKQGEAFDNFFTDCKQLLLNCNYRNCKGESIEDQLLRDKIVQGIADKSIQESLLRIDGLTLEKASNFCRTSEQSRLQVKEMNPTLDIDYSRSQSSKTNQGCMNNRGSNNSKTNQGCMTNRSSNNNKTRWSNKSSRYANNKEEFKCRRCQTIHGPRKCPAYGQRCNKCGIKNHFAVSCKVNRVEKCDEELYCHTAKVVSSVNSVNKSDWYENIIIETLPVKCKLDTGADVHTAVQQTGFKRVKRGFRPLRLPETEPAAEPRDPYFPLQWYLKNTGQNGGKPKLDLNVEAAWAQGYTGVNVTTAIMDDGVDYMHPDLKYNYNAEASYDFSSNDPFPYPRYTDDWFNSHGTRCAGEVAAARDNGVCGVGVAYHSKVAGIRMLDQPYMTDLIEANSMGHEPHKIHIYSASWGPTDDGRTVDGPRNATMRAIVRGVNEGRNGLGNIYVWASGDGGEDDDCNCDGYAASMWTVSINSAINDGQNAHYDESCSSTLASTFSNGARDPSTGVATTDLYGKCTATHSGTSAAAPEAAGVFALALHANPNLTWRDIQHLTVLTSKRNSLYDAKGRFHWTMNGVGLEFNHLFGFGVLDAGAMTALAANWRSVPPRYHCEAGSVNTHTEIPSEDSITLHIKTTACAGSPSEVRYLEHVQAVVSANATRRGDLELFLTSPMGTRSMILSRRANDDDSRDGFTKWPFMTTHTWGEYPQGTWTLEVRFSGGSGPSSASGWLRGWSLVLHGTRAPPYAQLQPQDPHSKLAVVKKAHEDNATE